MADPKATPISALPRGPQGQGDEDQQFIQNILQQMNNDNQESEKAYNEVQQNYNKQQFAVNHGEQHENNQKKIKEMKKAEYEQMEDEDYEEYQYEEEVPMTFMDKLKVEIKAPIVFVILYFILSIPFVRYFITDQLKRFTENKNILIYSSALICGLVGGIIFYFISKFLL